MQDTPSRPAPAELTGSSRERLSYKFQRLRERIRQAVLSGELAGKLPGERELARMFHANPKTLSKALTDLAAEGLLDRSIGRGTYVRGSQTEAPVGRWLVMCDPGQEDSVLVHHLRAANSTLDVAGSNNRLRPSFISQFDAVLDLSSTTDDAFHRSMLVRGIPVVLIGRTARTFNVHCVALDRTHAAWRLAREMLLAGHQRITIIEDPADSTVSDAVRLAASRYQPQAQLTNCPGDELAPVLADSGAAVICDGVCHAQKVRSHLAQSAQPASRSIAAVGVCNDAPPCTGIYITPGELAKAAVDLLKQSHVQRPTTLWLTGAYVQAGTLQAISEKPSGEYEIGPFVAISA